MVHTFVMIYSVGWIVGSVAAFVIAERLQKPNLPVWPRATVSVAAGFLWPVLVVGVVEIGMLRAYAKLAGRRTVPVSFSRAASREKALAPHRDC